jgi:hypothetical protein
MGEIDCTVLLLTNGRDRFWFAVASDLSTLRIDGADVLQFDVDDEVNGPGYYRQLYSCGSRVKGRIRTRWFLWRHGARN